MFGEKHQRFQKTDVLAHRIERAHLPARETAPLIVLVETSECVLEAGQRAEGDCLGGDPRAQELWHRVQRAVDVRLDFSSLAGVERWKASRFDPVRQYVRLLHSLVLFAEHELTPAASR